MINMFQTIFAIFSSELIQLCSILKAFIENNRTRDWAVVTAIANS